MKRILAAGALLSIVLAAVVGSVAGIVAWADAASRERVQDALFIGGIAWLCVKACMCAAAMNEDIIAVRIWPRGFWLRICGYGPHVMLARDSSKLFSERIGTRKVWYFGALRLTWLKP